MKNEKTLFLITRDELIQLYSGAAHLESVNETLDENELEISVIWSEPVFYAADLENMTDLELSQSFGLKISEEK